MSVAVDHCGARALRQEIADLAPWFHNLHLPQGVETCPDHPLGDFPAFKWREIAPHIPRDLSGWRVLDIGCNAGFYGFELAARGAHVTGIDIDAHYLDQARWAAGRFGLQDRIEFRRMQIYDLAREPESYDLVWFMGVLYHLRHPLLALDIVRKKVRRMLIVQTLTMPGEEVAPVADEFALDERAAMLQPGWPKMAFIEHSMAGDPTNWWAPNHACVEAMLRASGFHVRARIAHETYRCEPAEMDAQAASMVDGELKATTGS